MRKTPRLTVVIPVYNAQEHLERCLDSVLGQTIEDIEVILINDGSTDASAQICDLYAKKDSRVMVSHETNGGPAKARNRGILQAAGDYIGFVDSDDYIKREMYECLLGAAEKEQADIGICSYYSVNQDKCNTYTHPFGDKKVYDGDKIKDEIMQKFYVSDVIGLSSLWNKVYKRSFLTKHNLKLDESLIRAEDYWFNFEAISKAEKITAIEGAYYYYVDNPNGIMHRFRETQYEDWVRNRKMLLKHNETLNLTIDYHDFYYRFIYNVSTYMLQLMINKQNGKVKEILRHPFFRSAICYDKRLPIYIRVCNRLVKMHLYTGAEWLYVLWSKKHMGAGKSGK